MEQNYLLKILNKMEQNHLSKIIISYEFSNALSNLKKEDAEALAILSQLNKQTQQFYKDLALKSYLKQGNLETLYELIEKFKKSNTESKKQSLKNKIRQVISILSKDEYSKFVNQSSETIPKNILRFVSANKLQKDVLDNINLLVELNLPIAKEKWNQIFSSIGYFQDALPLVKYLSFQRKRLIAENQWNKKIDNTIIVPLRSDFDSVRQKWAWIVYLILGDELFEMLPEDISKRVYNAIH